MEKESFLESIKKGLWIMPSGERMTTVQYLTKWIKYWFSLLFNRKQRKLEEEREQQKIERSKMLQEMENRMSCRKNYYSEHGEEVEQHYRKVFRKNNY